MAVEIGFGPLERIDGPPPIAPGYGLLKAATEVSAAGVRIVPDVDDRGIERWINGAQVYPYPPDTGGVHDPCATGSDAEGKDFGSEVARPKFSAMTAYLPETCSSYKVWDQEEFKARATTVFTAIESFIIAREFISGDELPLNPHLSDGNGTFPNGDTVTSVENGLELLEGEIAKSGRHGLVHCSPMAATKLRQFFGVDNKTGVVRTINGTVIIPDFGYVYGATPKQSTSTAHPAASGTQEWMYATGPVDIRRSEIFVVPDEVSQALERGTPDSASTGRPNSITYRAERYYLVTWDTEVQASVLVDRCQANC